MTNATATPGTFVISNTLKILLGTRSMPFYEGTVRHRRSSFRFPRQEGVTMLDESQRLREDHHLLSLLSHYAEQGTEDRATWRDRLMQMEGVEAKELSALHGSLMAFDWIEQNTGQAVMLANGTLSACYRITLNGLREYGRFHGVKIEEKPPETAEKKKFPRKKKQASDMPETPIIAASEESPEIPETPEKKKQESDSIEGPVVATLEESPETTETLKKKEPKFPGGEKQESDSPEAPVVVASEESPETPEMPETLEKKKFPREQESDLPEAPVVAVSEESAETTETPEKELSTEQRQESDSLEAPVVAASEGSSETPEMKVRKVPKKKKQKSDSPEAPVVAASEESLVPAA
jgi:hypothetical protein